MNRNEILNKVNQNLGGVSLGADASRNDILQEIELNTRSMTGAGESNNVVVTDGSTSTVLKKITVSGDSITVLPTGELQIEIPDLMPLIEKMMPATMVAWSGYESAINAGEHKLPYQFVISDNYNTVNLEGEYVSHISEQIDVTIMMHVTGGKSKGGTLKISTWTEKERTRDLIVDLPPAGQTIPAYRFQLRGNAVGGVAYHATYEFSNPPTGYLAPYRTFISVDSIGKTAAYRSAIGWFENVNLIVAAGTEVVTSRDVNTGALRVKAREINKEIVNVSA